MPKTVPPKPAAPGKQPKIKAVAGGPERPAEKPLSVEEREALREMFRNPVFAKAFNNARLAKPTVFAQGLASEHGGKVATIQLARLQGWEMFEAAMFMQTQDRILRQPAPTETFPDAGLPIKPV